MSAASFVVVSPRAGNLTEQGFRLAGSRWELKLKKITTRKKIMKKVFIATFLAALVCTVGTGTATAQDDGFKVIPVELYACTYNDRKGPADLDRWVTKWSSWADQQGIDDYAAWTLTPYYYGPGDNANIDVIWMGAGKDAVGLGKTQETWMASNGGLNDEILEILTCASHANYASINHKALPQSATPQDSVLTFSDCTFEEGASFAGLGAAMGEWAKYLSDAGSTSGIFHWYPVYGGGGEDFDFKWLQAYQSLSDLGADYERYGNGRGFVTRGRLLNHIVDCDSARAYLAKNRRFVQLR
jgi:hypothetical protein